MEARNRYDAAEWRLVKPPQTTLGGQVEVLLEHGIIGAQSAFVLCPVFASMDGDELTWREAVRLPTARFNSLRA